MIMFWMSSYEVARGGLLNANVLDNRIATEHGCHQCCKKNQCLAMHFIGDAACAKQIVFTTNNHISKGSFLQLQGEPFEKVYVLKSGSTKSAITSLEGTEQIVGFEFAGDMLGFEAFGLDEYVSSVMALEDVLVCSFSRKTLDVLIATNANVKKYLIAQFGLTIAKEYRQLLLVNQNSAEQRMAIFLLELMCRLGKNTLKICMSRADIANYLGLASETVSRVLTRFEIQGIVSVKKKNIRILDEALLVQYSQHHPVNVPSAVQALHKSSRVRRLNIH